MRSTLSLLCLKCAKKTLPKIRIQFMLCIVFKVPPNLIGSQYEKLIIHMQWFVKCAPDIPFARKTVVILRLESRTYHSFIMFKNGANSLLSRLSLSTPLAMAIKRTPFSLNITSV